MKGAFKEGGGLIRIAQSSLIQFDDSSLLTLSIAKQIAVMPSAMLPVLMCRRKLS
jgi:hypothetical protein